MTERQQISKRLRYEVLRRDAFRCRYCGAVAEDGPLTADHVIPVALGGSDGAENLVTACQSCNAGKSATSPSEELVAEVDARAEQWADAIRRAAEIQNAQRERTEKYVAEFDVVWCEWSPGDGLAPMRPTNWRSTVAIWHSAGLEIETLAALVDDVMPRKIPNGRIWRYFCGAVGRVLKERQMIAQALLEERS